MAVLGILVIGAVGAISIVTRGEESAGPAPEPSSWTADTTTALATFHELNQASPLEPDDGSLLARECPILRLVTLVEPLPDGTAFDSGTEDVAMRMRPTDPSLPEQFRCYRLAPSGEVVGVIAGLASSDHLSEFDAARVLGAENVETYELDDFGGGELLSLCVVSDDGGCGAVWSDGKIEITVMTSALGESQATRWARVLVPALVTSLGSFDANDIEVLAEGTIREQQADICHIERLTIETASEAYEAQFGRPPTSQQELVDADLLYGPTVNFDVSADGTVVLARGSTCE